MNELFGVSCTSKGACTAVGLHAASMSSPGFALVERWNGTKWTIEPTVLSRGATSTELNGVSCASVTACSAVGQAVEKAGHRSVNLAEAWDGRTWRIEAVPNPKGSTDADLMAVSCTSPRACTAVGFFGNSSGRFALAERWNGTTWRIETLPKPATTELFAVSCSAAKRCTAVGYYHAKSGTRPLAEAWNGTTWHIQSVPLPKGAPGGIFAAVSCTSPSACTATGGNFGNHPTLAGRWNGRRWRVQPTPTPADAASSHQEVELNAVSCRSATSCTATGGYAPHGYSAYFLEAWNGHGWRLVTAPHPAGFASGALNEMSCVPTRCTAVGAFSGGPILIATLAMAG